MSGTETVYPDADIYTDDKLGKLEREEDFWLLHIRKLEQDLQRTEKNLRRSQLRLRNVRMRIHRTTNTSKAD